MPTHHRISCLFLGLVCSCSLAFAACGPGGDQNGTDVVIIRSDTGGCENGQSMCGGKCVETESNIDHCGECGNACAAGGFICSSGECQCIESEHTNCDGKCLNLNIDSQNCGACGNTCDGGERCDEGECTPLSDIESVVAETNRIREMGYDCDSKGNYPPADPVEANAELHKAAQAHADSMADNRFFSHTYPPPDCDPATDDGCHDFAWRIRQTDYQGQPMGENIAYGQQTPKSVVEGWAESDGHCANMMNSGANEMGVGRAVGNRIYWVQVFGKQ